MLRPDQHFEFAPLPVFLSLMGRHAGLSNHC